MLSPPEWVKDPKVLLLISTVLNAVFVAIIMHDGNISITSPYVNLAKFDVNDHVKALFAKPADLPQVRASLEERRFYEISPDNPRSEPIAQALIALADSKSAPALVVRLRDMVRDLKGPFKEVEQQVKIVAKKDEDGVSEGIAQVCLDSGFEGMYLTIWSNDQRGGLVTVHAAAEKECPPLSRNLVGLHAQDWNRLFDPSEGPRMESILVKLHPPRITLPSASRQIAQANPLPH